MMRLSGSKTAIVASEPDFDVGRYEPWACRHGGRAATYDDSPARMPSGTIGLNMTKAWLEYVGAY